MDGDHDIDACEAATGRTLSALYDELANARVDLPGTLLKVNMIVSGAGCPTQADEDTVARATIRCLTAWMQAARLADVRRSSSIRPTLIV